MRIPSFFHRRHAAIELQLTPMIDCVFLLMIYFLWSSNFAVSELVLPSKLSMQGAATVATPATPPPEADFPPTVIRVLWNGTSPAWTINGTPVQSLDKLRERLAAIAGIKADAPLILDPAGDVPLGDVIAVFDLSRLLGFQKVQLAAALPMER
jgi:biopolymer transport protein ExbD